MRSTRFSKLDVLIVYFAGWCLGMFTYDILLDSLAPVPVAPEPEIVYINAPDTIGPTTIFELVCYDIVTNPDSIGKIHLTEVVK